MLNTFEEALVDRRNPTSPGQAQGPRIHNPTAPCPYTRSACRSAYLKGIGPNALMGNKGFDVSV